MRSHNAGSFVLPVSLLLLAAICGYAVGHGRRNAAPVESVRDASNANAMLEYPAAAGWRPATRAPALLGLAFAQPLVLAPAGDPTRTGLIAGLLPGNATSPLPPAFLAHLVGLPKTEVVGLDNAQAYRYSGITSGSARFTLYAIPSSTPTEMAVACYAAGARAGELQTCERIAATLTVTSTTGAAPVNGLAPSIAYERQISAAVGRVNQLRTALRTALGARVSQGTAAALTTRLVNGLTGVLSSLNPLQAPAVAEAAQAELLRALSRTRDAYAALGAAAGAGDQTGYAAARARIARAEASLNGVLSDYSLLGYS
jgi:hypothetical protein